jgi:hypothetical protein
MKGREKVLGEYLVTLLASHQVVKAESSVSHETDPSSNRKLERSLPGPSKIALGTVTEDTNHSDILLKIAQSYLNLKILVRQYSEIELQILRT